MNGRPAHLVVVLALAFCGLIACSRPPGPSSPAAAAPTAPATTPAADPSPTPAAAPTDPYAVPAVIDKAYVERVLHALGRSYADAANASFGRRRVSATAVKILAATHLPRSLEDARRDMNAVLSGRASAQFKYPAQPIRARVLKISTGSSQCIFSLAVQDTTGLLTGGRRRESLFFHLVRTPTGRDPDGLNPTGWVIAGVAPRPDEGTFEDPCAD